MPTSCARRAAARPTPISTWSGSDERTVSRRRRVRVAGPRDARAGPLAEAADARTDAVRGHDGVRRRPAVRDRRGGIRHRRGAAAAGLAARSEEHTSELQSLMRISYAVFCLKKKQNNTQEAQNNTHNPQHTEHKIPIN